MSEQDARKILERAALPKADAPGVIPEVRDSVIGQQTSNPYFARAVAATVSGVVDYIRETYGSEHQSGQYAERADIIADDLADLATVIEKGALT